MSEKMYSATEVNRMLEAVEQQKWNLFSDYGKLLQEIDDLKMENEILKERNILLRSILVDALKGI